MDRGRSPGAQVSYQHQYRRCGKATCTRCAAGGLGHGPYWYAFWWENGRTHSRYLGKQAPPGGALPDAAAHTAPSPSVQATTAVLRVHTLGGFAVWRGATELEPRQWRSQRATTLFKGLLSAPGHRLTREQAIDLLWPDGAWDVGASNLRTTIHLLRQMLDDPQAGRGESYLRSEGAVIALVPASVAEPVDDWLDADVFARTAQRALAGADLTACRTALALYGGEYLPDDPYAAWAEPVRVALRRQYLDLLLHLAALSGARGELEESEGCLRRALASEPGHEEVAATLMSLLAASGRRAEALRVYQALSTVLEDDLAVAPSAELVTLRARLVAQEAAPHAAGIPPRQSDPVRHTNLPAAATSFVGRSWELTAITEALATARLVTLTGPGGCGKTRLAIEVADRLVDTQAYPDGVWLVELAALADPALVPQAIATTLGVRVQPGQALLDTLIQMLQPRQMLLVLDNCEHLSAACTDLAMQLLRACPGLRMLATSRAELGVWGEHTFRVPPLTVPDPADMPPLERLAAYEAVALFLERAQARRPELTLTAANAVPVAQICARLDGLPLAIELAAARVNMVPVPLIAERLDDRFGLLTGGPRTALPRQQTLRATLDWSYALLSAAEQRLLRRLAVFAGGWTLEAAEAVCAGAGLRTAAVPDLLGGLIRHSLVRAMPIDGAAADATREPRAEEVADAPSVVRFGLLDTIRAYALERLQDSGEAEAQRVRHVRYYLSLAEAEAPPADCLYGLWVSGSRARPGMLQRERENMRTALTWACESGAASSGWRLVAALWAAWMAEGLVREGAAWGERLLAVIPRDTVAIPPALRAQALHATARVMRCFDPARAQVLGEEALALYGASVDQAGQARVVLELGGIAEDQGQMERADLLYDEALGLYRVRVDQRGMAHAVFSRAMLASRQGNQAQAVAWLEEAGVLFGALSDASGVVAVQAALGHLAWEQGDYGRAKALLTEILNLAHQRGAVVLLQQARRMLSLFARDQGDYEQAQAWAAEMLTTARAAGDRHQCAWALLCLGDAARDQGDAEATQVCCEESLALFHECGNRVGVALACTNLGLAALEQGEHARARSLLEEALALGPSTEALDGLALLALDQGDVPQAERWLRGRLERYGMADCVAGVVNAVDGMASMAALQGRAAHAAYLYGAATGLREAHGIAVRAAQRRLRERGLILAREALDAQSFVTMERAGRALSREQAIAAALAESNRAPAPIR